MITWLSGLYYLVMAGIALFGVLGLITLWFYRRHRNETFPCPSVDISKLPTVTVQLPLYNERFVVKRLIDSTVALDYPREKLQIQVIDDSTDDTTSAAAMLVKNHQGAGVNISLIHRSHREGFKAGALQNALDTARGEYIAVFDADFVPLSDFLIKTIPYFLAEDKLGLVQARWGHINYSHSQLTGAQAIALDKHFAMEQTVRHRADLFPKFNGSAGIWRRECLEDAGGWESDTVCEDLCLSTRAVLRRWRFLFLNDVIAPAELPTTILAYKNQQARWAKGSTQCLFKFGKAIATAGDHSLLAKAYALISMAGYTTHLLLLLLLLIQVPLIYFGYRPSSAVFAFVAVGIAQPILFVLGQRESYRDWFKRLLYFPSLLVVAIGLAPANSRAILQGTFSRNHTFVRTPKGQAGGTAAGNRRRSDRRHQYRLPLDWIIVVEIGFAAYAAVGLVLCLINDNLGPLLFMASCTVGFGYVAYSSISEQL